MKKIYFIIAILILAFFIWYIFEPKGSIIGNPDFVNDIPSLNQDTFKEDLLVNSDYYSLDLSIEDLSNESSLHLILNNDFDLKIYSDDYTILSFNTSDFKAISSEVESIVSLLVHTINSDYSANELEKLLEELLSPPVELLEICIIDENDVELINECINNGYNVDTGEFDFKWLDKSYTENLINYDFVKEENTYKLYISDARMGH